MLEPLPFTLDSPDATRALGQRLGAACVGGEVFLLGGILGAGKTCLVQGLGVGLDVPDEYVVCSPTYILHAQYPGRLELNHLDLYRLADAAPTAQVDLGFEEFIAHPESVTAIEWAEYLAGNLPAAYIKITIVIVDDHTRECTLAFVGGAAEMLYERLEKDA